MFVDALSLSVRDIEQCYSRMMLALTLGGRKLRVTSITLMFCLIALRRKDPLLYADIVNRRSVESAILDRFRLAAIRDALSARDGSRADQYAMFEASICLCFQRETEIAARQKHWEELSNSNTGSVLGEYYGRAARVLIARSRSWTYATMVDPLIKCVELTEGFSTPSR
jgi:hypothetical protein